MEKANGGLGSAFHTKPPADLIKGDIVKLMHDEIFAGKGLKALKLCACRAHFQGRNWYRREGKVDCAFRSSLKERPSDGILNRL
ncbi:hypothetical protein CEXT_774251 [Caerostris extrusa]|uniref:Uncharacterized protein n=1 Tax=Caerostris extrusa TaxID=172846 RepID=A0AAV4V500_CAEEX|nr:hypothetical protein CEXT_774251 [Caerostris extrusa]